MAVQLPPIPNNPVTDVFVWRDWFFKVSQLLVQQASIAWTSIDFTGSNLQDIQTRQHNALQSIQGGIGGQYYHLTATEYATVQAFPSIPLTVPNGGTGATTLTGYVYGNGTGAFTASTTIPWSVITGAPSITSPKYGAFQDSTTQSAASTTTAYAITFDTTDFSNNVTMVSSSRITFAAAGIYNIQFSLQLSNLANSTEDVDVWFRVNGTDIPKSNSIFGLAPRKTASDPYHIIAAINYYAQVAANDYIQLMWRASNTAITIKAQGAQTSPTRPATPSAIVTVNQIA
jgi:hypothetical protein